MSRRWKEVKENPTRLMRNEAEIPGDDFLVHEKTMAERSAVRQPQKAPKTPKFLDTQER